MTKPDLYIPWPHQTQIRRILLTNGRIVDLEEPVNDSRQALVDTICEHYGDDVNPTAGYAILPQQQEIL